jgi:ABC-type transport system involved in cytochrome bd biosynthesis fused ATPase/permease subunit
MNASAGANGFASARLAPLPLHDALRRRTPARRARRGAGAARPLFVADEPTAHLAPAAARRLRALLASWRSDGAILIVDHRLDGMLEWIDRVFVLGNEGRDWAELSAQSTSALDNEISPNGAPLATLDEAGNRNRIA